MVYSLRNLLISFAIVILVVLLIVLRTFSALRSQEKEQEKITQCREALQKLGPAIFNMQEFESVATKYFNTGDSALLDHYHEVEGKLKNDSAGMTLLAANNRESSLSYKELADIIHRMITLSAAGKQAKTEQGEGVVALGPLIEQFKNIATKLEDENRAVLNSSYSHSIRLTRETFSFVRIISGLLVVILVISFYFIYHDIKTRKRTEEQLKQFNTELEKQVTEKASVIRKNEERYRSLFDSMSDAYAKCDMEGKIIEFNSAFMHMLGYAEEEIYKLSYKDITPVKWYEMEDEILLKQILVRGFSDVYEKEYWHKNGRIFPVELRGFLLKDDSGIPVAIWAIVRDISSRKEAEKKLAESEKNLRYVMDSMSDNFYVLDKNCRVTLINEVAQKNLLKAWGKEVTVGTNILDMIPGGEGEPIRVSLDKVFAGEKIEYELFNVKEGLPPWVSVTYTPVSDETGTIIGACISAKDITERKKAEQEILKANERFGLISRATHDAIWDWDMINNRNWGNSIFYEYYGIKPGETWKYENFLSRVHPDDKRRIEERMQAAIEKKGEVVIEEFRFRMPQGHYRHFFDRAYIIYDKDNKPVRMLGSMMDVTEKYLLEQEILKQKIQEQKIVTRAVINAEESERNKIGRELHDNVNQILASIKLFLRMATERDTPSGHELLTRAVKLVDNAIDEIRSLSQSQVTPAKKVDLKEMIQALVDRLDDSTSIKTVFTFENDKEIDDDLKLNIYRIVQEQINNVLKYAEANTITIRVYTDNNFFCVSVADDGKGFDTGAKRKGIGISNMINRVESFNGELNIISSPGNGCTIEIRIPC
ncbi:MAG TPA: PAS domain S-box protein [Chitinophagaceae bacterium]